MLRLVTPLILLTFTLLVHTPTSAQEFDIPSVTISGGDLPHAVELAPADADAFRRRVNLLPRLEDKPAATGSPFTVTTSYWAVAIRLEDDEDELDVSVRGDYYPDGGFVRLTLEGGSDGLEEVWVVINIRQRAILDRYIRLAKAGAIGETPSTLDVLAAASQTETFSVEAGTDLVAPETAAAILEALAASNPAPFIEPREPPFLDDSGFWLIVTLVEGRTLRYYFRTGMLTESLGTEQYDASTLLDLMESIAPSQPPLAIDQEEPAGSLLWWPVMAGGGLLVIGAAILLRRVSGATQP